MPRGIWERTEKHYKQIRECLNRTGKKNSPLHRGRISNGLTGKKYPYKPRPNFKGRFKGENNPNYGKPMSEETKKKLSLAHKGKRHTLQHRLKQSESIKKNLPRTISIFSNIRHPTMPIPIFRHHQTIRFIWACYIPCSQIVFSFYL